MDIVLMVQLEEVVLDVVEKDQIPREGQDSRRIAHP
jgi:hypothetical protein